MRILVDDLEIAPLVKAMEDAPLSLGLREMLRAEIGKIKSVDGVFDCSDVTATDTGDWRVRIRIGRAGEALGAAFRALTVAVEGESHDARS